MWLLLAQCIQMLILPEVWEATVKKQAKTARNQGKMLKIGWKKKEKAEVLAQETCQKRGKQLKSGIPHPCQLLFTRILGLIAECSMQKKMGARLEFRSCAWTYGSLEKD